MYATLRNITVERRPQKRTFSSARLWWCGIVTFFQNRVISILKKMYGCTTCVTTRMVLYLYYDKLHINNICTTYNLWNVYKFYSFPNKHNITPQADGVQHLKLSTYTLCQAY
jgi:hypothetical protein